MYTPERTQASLRDFLHILFKRKIQIILFFCATICTVAVGTFMAKPTYQTVAQLLIKVGRENIYVPTVPTSGASPPVFSFNREEQINSEIEILKSRFLAEKVVGSLGPATIYKGLNNPKKGFVSTILRGNEAPRSPADTAVLNLQNALTVEGVKKSDVIDVSFKHTDPRMAASVVNTLVDFYLDHHVNVHKNPQSYRFFQEQARVLKGQLTHAEEQLKAFKKQHDITSLDEEKTLQLTQEAALRAALNQTLSQRAETENRVRQLRLQLAATPKTVPQGEEIDHNPFLLDTLQARLIELELKEKDLLTKYTEQSLLVQNVRDEIQLVREKLAMQETKRYGKTRSGLNVTYQRVQEDLLRNEADLKALKAKEETQRAHLADYREKLAQLNRIEMELNRLEHEVDVNRQNYRLYLTKFEESRISDAMDTEKIANVSLIEPARPPLKPVSPRIFLNLVLGVFLGAFGALGLAFFTEYLDDSLEKTDDVEDCLNIPVLASIPEMKK